MGHEADGSVVDHADLMWTRTDPDDADLLWSHADPLAPKATR